MERKQAAAAVIKLSAGQGNRLHKGSGRAHININPVTGSCDAWNQLPTSSPPVWGGHGLSHQDREAGATADASSSPKNRLRAVTPGLAWWV